MQVPKLNFDGVGVPETPNLPGYRKKAAHRVGKNKGWNFVGGESFICKSAQHASSDLRTASIFPPPHTHACHICCGFGAPRSCPLASPLTSQASPWTLA
jgi:hypothetical protein